MTDYQLRELRQKISEAIESRDFEEAYLLIQPILVSAMLVMLEDRVFCSTLSDNLEELSKVQMGHLTKKEDMELCSVSNGH